MRPLLNASYDPAEYVAIACAVGVDPYELLAQAENEGGGRRRRIDLTLCSHPVDGRSRREAVVADRGLGRLNWADCGPSVIVWEGQKENGRNLSSHTRSGWSNSRLFRAVALGLFRAYLFGQTRLS
jgi:hypothetical protein